MHHFYFYPDMELFTKVDIPFSDFKIDYTKKTVFIGSCFAEKIAKKFLERKFQILLNPLGIVYNPLSIANMLERISLCGQSQYRGEELFFDGERWNCWDAHGSLSVAVSEKLDRDGAKIQCATRLNSELNAARDFLKEADTAFITLGTAFVYFLKETGKAVSNCHRQKPELFDRRMITVAEGAAALQRIVHALQSLNPRIRVVFTVSPLRHLSDGAHGNNLSKATLHLAIQSAMEDSGNGPVGYFPSYEIAMDELRDYRFYEEDMIHLSETAEEYIFQRMVETYCEQHTVENMRRVEKFMKTVNHRITNENSPKIEAFAKSQIAAAKFLESNIRGLDLGKEKTHYEEMLGHNGQSAKSCV